LTGIRGVVLYRERRLLGRKAIRRPWKNSEKPVAERIRRIESEIVIDATPRPASRYRCKRLGNEPISSGKLSVEACHTEITPKLFNSVPTTVLQVSNILVLVIAPFVLGKQRYQPDSQKHRDQDRNHQFDQRYPVLRFS
jgi:hypothetical protein